MKSSTPTDIVKLPLLFKHIGHTLSIDADLVPQVRWQRDVFLHALSHPTQPDVAEPSSAEELILRFLGFLVENNASSTILQCLLRTFEKNFLKDNDVHLLISSLPVTANIRRDLFCAFYTARSRCVGIKTPPSALLDLAEQDQANLFAVFGGQGTNNPRCVASLATLYSTYKPFIAQLIDEVASPLLYKLCRLPETEDHYCGRYIELSTWLQNPSKIPNTDFISQAPVSFPIIGLLSLAQYSATCQVLGLTPGELRAHIRGTTGHSQGLVIAAAISLAESWESFYDISRQAIELLFWLGFYCHQARPASSVSAALVKECLENGEGQPSSMLSVRGLDRLRVEALLAKFNKNLKSEDQLLLALENARDNFVLAGPVTSLVHMNSYFRSLKAKDGLDQSRVPFSSRKPVIHHQFLPISAPFHTSYLSTAAEKVKLRLRNMLMTKTCLAIPVYHSKTADDLRDSSTDNLVDVLVDAIACEQCQWPAALKLPQATHILAFDVGIGDLVMKVKEGEGVRIIDVTNLDVRAEAATAADFYSSILLTSAAPIESWGKQFQPRLARSSNGDWVMQTKLSQLLSCPPVMVAGMTPTTTHWDFVSSIMKAGYHIELAAGGFYNAEAMSSAIEKLVESLPAGRGVTCNVIYASPHTLSWQIATLRMLSRKGLPIHGLTIGAGIPSADIVAEYINTLGIKHISFKPGSSSAIRDVIDIAKAHPNFPIILQWTGGRGGGHHSYEDFHAPILNLYGAIRRQSNIILVAGSGFGGAEDTYPYLTGAWASRFGYVFMPFDGVLLGSRMMVAQEAYTSLESKLLICQASGVPDSDWEKSYRAATGGIVTVQSEMGQPIHKIANRGVLFWAEMDRKIFNLPRKERLPKLLKSKDTIIQRLNADFAKPWFGRTSAGKVAEVAEMTYTEVLERMVSLMYVSHQKRWIDPSYATFVYDFTCRALQRLPHDDRIELSPAVLDDPRTFLANFASSCPEASTTILNPEDSAFFLLRSRSRGQKPVNFIPVLDDNFEYYFKKDSLWQSEDIDAVVDRDAGRVCILHGPVAAQYSHRCDESAQDILDGIAHSHVEKILGEQYGRPITPLSDDESLVQSGSGTPDSWALASPTSSAPTTMETPFVCKSPGSQTQLFSANRIANQFPSSFLAGRCSNSSTLLRALFGSDHIIRDGSYKVSPLRRILEPRSGASLSIDREAGKVLLEKDNGLGPEILAEISCKDNMTLAVELRQPSSYRDDYIALPFEFELQTDKSPWTFSEVMQGRNLNIKSFYSKLWFDQELDPGATVHSTFSGKEMVLTYDMYQNFLSTVGQSYSNGPVVCGDSAVFPIGFGIVVVWDVITKPLVLRDIDGDLLCLVHQSNSFEYTKGASALRIGDLVSATSRVREIYIEEAGKYVVVEAEVMRDGKSVMTVRSTFLFKGKFNDFSSTFKHKQEQDMMIEISSRQDAAILHDREWFQPHDSTTSLVGTTLLFQLQSNVTWKKRNVFKSMSVSGTVLARKSDTEFEEIGKVDFYDSDCVGNPVMDFLERKASSTTVQSDLRHPGWSDDGTVEVQIPSSNERYARVSKDYNPIHVSPLFADWAELPGTITHGMYTSAVAASALEHLAADGDLRRLYRWSATFTGMVLPEDKLNVRLQHVGMIEGRMRVKVSAYNEDTDETVLEAEAEVAQASTAYVFTGQGSQSKGMGMDLYNSSPVAKAVWDDVDGYLSETYGEYDDLTFKDID